MSQRDTFRAVRLESIFQAAVSEFAVPDNTARSLAPAVTSTIATPSADLFTDSALSPAIGLTTLAVTAAADTQPPAALRPYEPIASDGVIANWEVQNPVHLRGQAVGGRDQPSP